MASTPPAVPDSGTLGLRAVNVFTKLHVLAHRVTRGRIGGTMQGAPVCILHTVGRKSGKQRETPLFYLADGQDLIIVASAGGREAAPAWWLNLQAMDTAEVEIKGKRTRMKPRRASAEEKAAYWPKLNAMYEHYEGYQERTARDIAVIVMSPA